MKQESPTKFGMRPCRTRWQPLTRRFGFSKMPISQKPVNCETVSPSCPQALQLHGLVLLAEKNRKANLSHAGNAARIDPGSRRPQVLHYPLAELSLRSEERRVG